LVRNPEGKALLERSTYRRKYNIKIDLKVIGQKGVDSLRSTFYLNAGANWSGTYGDSYYLIKQINK
jgi:hypothetical protein